MAERATSMCAWRVDTYGAPEQVLRFAKIDPPRATPGTVVLRVHAAGVNFADLLAIAGEYQVKSPLPFTPGSEAAGTVLAAGPDVDLAPGTRVAAFHLNGAFAEQMQAASPAVFPLPDAMPWAEAAALTTTYQTAYFALALRARTQPGEVVLVHAGASGVGSAAIQVAKAMGAVVIATASTQEKLTHCRNLGADYTINYREQDFVDEVRRLTDHGGADVVYDPVGGDVFDRSTRCIAWEGRLVVIGFASGRIPEIRANRILLKNISIVGLQWPYYLLHAPQKLAAAHQHLVDWYKAGKISPLVDTVRPLSELPQALTALRSRRAAGKVVLRAND